MKKIILLSLTLSLLAVSTVFAQSPNSSSDNTVPITREHINRA